MKLIVEKRTIYGRDLYYPVNETAELFCKLICRETLVAQDLRTIKELGYSVELKREELCI